MNKKFINCGKVMLVVTIINLVACKKSTNSKICWDCVVTRMDGSTYNDKPCTDGRSPEYWDNRGNVLGSNCTKR
jgi:hypothetical protein